MLDESLKASIQQAYSRFLNAKSMRPRLGQKTMIAHIARTLACVKLEGESPAEGEPAGHKHILAVEAGTGTGKTVAYLLASIPLAQHFNKTLVLSTATIALQEQVVIKDIPDLLQHSGLEFSFVLAKGRGRYLCLSKLERLLSDLREQNAQIPMYDDELPALTGLEQALYRDMYDQVHEGTWDGDRDSWRDEFDPTTWARVTTDHRQCTGRKCPNVRDCAFFKAREALEDADVVVANHDLVMADLALGGGAILTPPEDTIYVFDEAHHLPEKALNHFSAHTRCRASIRWLGQAEAQWPAQRDKLSELSYFQQLSEGLELALKQARSELELALPSIRAICDHIDPAAYTPRFQFPLGEVGAELEGLAERLSAVFAPLATHLSLLHQEIDSVVKEAHSVVPARELDGMLSLLATWLARAEANLALWQSYRDTHFNAERPMARWINLYTGSDATDYELISSPVLASGILQSGLWSRCAAAVLTSATLRALNRFDQLRMRTGLDAEAPCEVVQSPFDYERNAVLQVPRAAVDASRAADHTASLISLLPKLIDLEEGSLVLFSSHAQMNEVYEGLPEALQARILRQGQLSKQRIVAEHKQRVDEGEGSVIWGLASFAEGLDLPGDYCRHVLIAKLPFAVPDEPLEAAYSAWVEARGGRAFMEVAIPDASTKLLQACGRLLRTENDSGRISILDRRLVSKPYGRAMLDALPPFRRQLHLDLS